MTAGMLCLVWHTPPTTKRRRELKNGFNTLRLRQNYCRFSEDISKCIFSNENVCILLKISLEFVPKVRIDNIPALVRLWLGADQETADYLNYWWLVYGRIYASLGLNELTHWGLVTPFGDLDLGQRWLRYWLVAWRHQAITWTNVDLSSVKSSGIHLKGIS